MNKLIITEKETNDVNISNPTLYKTYINNVVETGTYNELLKKLPEGLLGYKFEKINSH